MTENFSQKVMFYKVVPEITMNNFVEHHFLWKVFFHDENSHELMYTSFKDTLYI
jgi:hypothetical protein